MTDERQNRLLEIHNCFTRLVRELTDLAEEEWFELTLIPDDPDNRAFYDDIFMEIEDNAQAIDNAAASLENAADYVMESISPRMFPWLFRVEGPKGPRALDV